MVGRDDDDGDDDNDAHDGDGDDDDDVQEEKKDGRTTKLGMLKSAQCHWSAHNCKGIDHLPKHWLLTKPWLLAKHWLLAKQ